MSEQEREAVRREGDEPEVEGHSLRRGTEDLGGDPESDAVRKEGDDPDVEGHMIRRS
jgi:hypothetical protein